MASKIHLLKCWPEFFKAVKSGEKTFEIRMNDREYQVGDVLIVSEYDPSTSTYTREHVSRRVTYLTSAYQVEGYVVMSLIPAAIGSKWLPLVTNGVYLSGAFAS